MSQPIIPIQTNDGEAFPSLAALRVLHNQLLRRYREQGNTPEILDEIAALIRRGKKLGALLDSEDDRWAAQGLLDYWSSMLYRAGYEPPDATLDEFDSTDAPNLEDSSCPYADFEPFQRIQSANLTVSELREVIEKPAELVGLKFEEGIVDALIQDTLYEPDGTSLLQFILLSLWEKRDRNKITWESYRQVSRGRQALIQAADQFFDGLTSEEQDILKRIMLNLAEFGKGPNLVKRRITRSELYDLLEPSEEVRSPTNLNAPSAIDNATSSDTTSASDASPMEFNEILLMLASNAPSPFTSDSPDIQDRYYALLKQRLLLESQRKPALFPWEAELPADYEAEELASLEATTQPSQTIALSFWSPQLAHLQLPVPMPKKLLEQLLKQCQTVAVRSLREGAKLVQAVESLFPGQHQLLNNVAGHVMVSPTRSGSAKLQDETSEGLPESFDSAIETQQMALSLLAARQIIEALSIYVCSEGSIVERRWDTRAGTLLLKVAYRNNQLLIGARLPCGGEMSLQTQTENIEAQRDDNGIVRLSLSNPGLNQIYPVKIQLAAPNSPSITFAIHLLKE